ncbi:hypothetical protein PoB_002134700 [Plakobranchus ocellatus]|uniref:CCHC-type domain-containing protein n=1 Tax=Plakobranchus ocellatus TaxID=259542 RepID=A0AAV3ZJW4_9GAST|nr:hypothetical protein PoB_002134700 [Plakobranchus ocellatus]
MRGKWYYCSTGTFIKCCESHPLCPWSGARQMCYYCGFQAHVGRECIDDPKHWRGGDPHNKCDSDCIIIAIFDAGKPTFVSRACQNVNRQEGCDVVGATHNCFFYCSGKDYCNDCNLTRSPLLDAGSGEASSLTPTFSLGFLFSVWSVSIVVRLVMVRVWRW